MTHQKNGFDRRSYLRASVSIGVASTIGFTGSVSAQETESGNTTFDLPFEQDFEEVSVGTVPDGFVLAGNESQEVIDAAGFNGTQSYQTSGNHGGCWRAITRIPIGVTDEMYIRGYYRLEDGAEGCHSGSGNVIFRSAATDDWEDGSSTGLLQFYPDGTVEGSGEVIGEYDVEEWTKFEIEYIRNRSNGEVTHTYSINDDEVASITREPDEHEDDLKALGLRSDDFTVLWDGLLVEDRSNTSAVPTVLQQFGEERGSPLIWLLAGISAVGGYVGYKKLNESRNQQEPVSTENAKNDKKIETKKTHNNLSVTQYSELNIGNTIRRSELCQIKRASVTDYSMWVLTPPTDSTETVSATTITLFRDIVEPWTKIDRHPRIATVYGSGNDSLPWVAVEELSGDPFIQVINKFSISELVKKLQQICEAVHHIYRYGISYENLTIDSVVIINKDEVKLRGILDQFNDADQWYMAPEEFTDDWTAQSAVYRIGLIAYELLTGTLPYAEYPNSDPETVILNSELIAPSDHVTDIPEEIDRVLLRALSSSPDDRHETVLHLRDEFDSLDLN